MSNESPSYFAIIPASVRYCNDIPNGAKLLYAEITCLCNDRGYCWASNDYFAKLYDVSNRTISRWISEIAKAGFIVTLVDSATANSRKIWLSETHGIDKNVHTHRQKRLPPIDKNVHIIGKYNSKDNNNIKAKADVAEFFQPLEEKKEKAAPVPAAPPEEPKSPAPYRRSFDLSEELTSIGSDYKMRENLTIVARVPQQYFDDYLTAFRAQEEAVGSNHNNRQELRKHFYNFCRARYSSSKSTTAAPTRTLHSQIPRYE